MIVVMLRPCLGTSIPYWYTFTLAGRSANSGGGSFGGGKGAATDISAMASKRTNETGRKQKHYFSDMLQKRSCTLYVCVKLYVVVTIHTSHVLGTHQKDQRHLRTPCHCLFIYRNTSLYGMVCLFWSQKPYSCCPERQVHSHHQTASKTQWDIEVGCS